MNIKLVEWEKDSEGLCEQLENYAKDYKCKKCPNKDPDFWCQHLLKERREKFRKKIKENLENLSIVLKFR